LRPTCRSKRRPAPVFDQGNPPFENRPAIT
jgi:hypothetical protein